MINIHQISIIEIAEDLGICYSSRGTIFDSFNIKLVAKFVKLKIFKTAAIAAVVSWWLCITELLKRVIICDELWVYNYYVEMEGLIIPVEVPKEPKMKKGH